MKKSLKNLALSFVATTVFAGVGALEKSFLPKASAQTKVARLTPSPGVQNTQFGLRMAMDWDLALIGAPYEDSVRGAAYLFRYDGNKWIEEQKLVANNGATLDYFGTALGVKGDVLVIGASGYGQQPDHQGTAYVYRYDGRRWNEEQQLFGNPTGEGCEFGLSISVPAENVILIGAPGGVHSINCPTGSVSEYRYNGGSWELTQTILGNDSDVDDRFGRSLSFAHDVLIVGAPGDDDHGSRSGSAYLFRHNGSEWIELQKLTASDGLTSDGFAHVVFSAGDRVAVSAKLQLDDQGAVYVYRDDGAQWIEEQKLTASDAEIGAFFGRSLAFTQDGLWVGSRKPFTPVSDTGSVYRYGYEAGRWVEKQKIVGSGGSARFGSAIASQDHEYIIVGATGEDAAYVYNVERDFLRGDADGNGSFHGLIDGFFLLNYQFLPGSLTPPCLDSADADDNGIVSGLVDGIYLLNYQFAGGTPPPSPGPTNCAQGNSIDSLGCEQYSCP